MRIEYTPNIDGDPDPGEVVWAWVPFEEDPTLGKDRPVVVIGRHGDALSGVALTSKQHRDTVEVGTGPWDAKGRTSYAKVDRLLDIDPPTVRREGAVLGRRRFDAVIDAVGKLHDIARLRWPRSCRLRSHGWSMLTEQSVVPDRVAMR